MNKLLHLPVWLGACWFISENWGDRTYPVELLKRWHEMIMTIVIILLLWIQGFITQINRRRFFESSGVQSSWPWHMVKRWFYIRTLQMHLWNWNKDFVIYPDVFSSHLLQKKSVSFSFFIKKTVHDPLTAKAHSVLKHCLGNHVSFSFCPFLINQIQIVKRRLLCVQPWTHLCSCHILSSRVLLLTASHLAFSFSEDVCFNLPVSKFRLKLIAGLV